MFLKNTQKKYALALGPGASSKYPELIVDTVKVQFRTTLTGVTEDYVDDYLPL